MSSWVEELRWETMWSWACGCEARGFWRQGDFYPRPRSMRRCNEHASATRVWPVSSTAEFKQRGGPAEVPEATTQKMVAVVGDWIAFERATPALHAWIREQLAVATMVTASLDQKNHPEEGEKLLWKITEWKEGGIVIAAFFFRPGTRGGTLREDRAGRVEAAFVPASGPVEIPSPYRLVRVLPWDPYYDAVAATEMVVAFECEKGSE